MGELWPDEPDYKQLYGEWAKSPSPQTAGALLKSLEPSFDAAISRHAGGAKSPVLRSHAKRLALDAIRTFDPNKGVRLKTHVGNHLQGLRRIARTQQQVLHVPERAAMEQAYLQRMHAELADKLGRDPSTPELADHTGLSSNKIAKLRRYVPGVAEGSLPEGADLVTASPFSPAHREEQLWQLVHAELEPRDQQILEWTTGLYGAQQHDNRSIAAKLRVSPGAVSQRKALIQKKMEQMSQLMDS